MQIKKILQTTAKASKVASNLYGSQCMYMCTIIVIVLHLSEFYNQYLIAVWDRVVVRDSICLQLHDDQSKMGTVRFDFFKNGM